MKKILLFLLPVLGCFSTACQELKKDAVELVFAETDMLDPDHLQLRYESPDPGCGIPKIYWITATAEENTLTLKCGGTDSLVAIGSWGVNGTFTATPGGKITSEAGHWTAVLTDTKTLSFTFDGVEDPDAEDYVDMGLTVSAVAGGRQTLVDFYITRLSRRHEPLTVFYRPV